MSNPAAEPDFRQKLLYRFRKQEEFTADYSRLYTRFFGTVADWLEKDESDSVVDWLLTASNGRNAFDIPLLLAAGLHRDVLLQEPGVQELAAFYPSVGGERPSTDPHFATALRRGFPPAPRLPLEARGEA